MSIYDERLKAMNPEADSDFIVAGEKYRITVLTDSLLRLEYSENGVFEDRATVIAYNRRFARPDYVCRRIGGILVLETDHLRLTYDEKPFCSTGLQITVDSSRTWDYGMMTNANNLGGTVRTLDRVDGAVELGSGLLSRARGFTVLDDSKTVVMPRGSYPVPLDCEGRKDIYFFGYNHRYEECIRDFYKLSAPVPLVPRFAFGNWWSRYHAYTAQEYIKLMDDFAARNIPMTTAVIDMDWHITKTPDPARFGGGWTGYTWNRELIPDPEGFLSELHRRGLATSLNIHPRDGIRAFETPYNAIATALGRNPEEGETVELDVADSRFMEEYTDKVLRSIEAQGVDFWWIDWQQSGGSSVPGYETLFMLNHCLYNDNTQGGKRPLILSRYGGPGSHRYPLGFSGDTKISWKSLEFQPYFTATAANIGYAYWSHDIGGHMNGYHDDELYTRWVQLGVFSPVMRLHSSPCEFMSREPWNYGESAERVVSDFMRLRHRMIPYLYSMACRLTEDGIPFVRPMYHAYPDNGGAYECRNEYLFGDSLVVAPITAPCENVSGLAKTRAWIPDGLFIDVFSNRVYRGGRTCDLYRKLDSMPVFARAGAIITLSDDAGNTVRNPQGLTVAVYGGADGKHIMTEDNAKDGEERRTAITEFTFNYGGCSVLSFTSPEGEAIPAKRDYTFRFAAFEKPDSVTVQADGTTLYGEFDYDETRREITVRAPQIPAGARVEVRVAGSGKLPRNEIERAAFEVLRVGCFEYGMKDKLIRIIRHQSSVTRKISELLDCGADGGVTGALLEIITADVE